MSGRDQKVQLGARVPKEIRQVAVDAAKAAGVSLNVWLEQAIAKAANRGTVPTPQLPIEQEQRAEAVAVATVDAVTSPPPAPVVPPVAKKPTLPAQPKLTRFASNCVNGAYHWKHGPGNPCRVCRGEI